MDRCRSVTWWLTPINPYGYIGPTHSFLTFCKHVYVTEIHTWGTREHAALVHSAFHKFYEMNEHNGKRKVR